MAELSEDQLRQLCEALGWQGGTFWQVLEEVKRLANPGEPVAYIGTKDHPWGVTLGRVRELSYDRDGMDDPQPLYLARGVEGRTK